MSKLMLKMLADMAGVKPEDIANSVEQFQEVAINGLDLLKSIDERLKNIEEKLGIETGVDNETKFLAISDVDKFVERQI